MRDINQHLQRTFQQEFPPEELAKATGREYVALLERRNWTYIKKINNWSPIPFVSDFGIQDKDGLDLPILYKTRFCISGDKKAANTDFDRNKLYKPAVRHWSIRIFANAAAQYLLQEELTFLMLIWKLKSVWENLWNSQQTARGTLLN